MFTKNSLMVAELLEESHDKVLKDIEIIEEDFKDEFSGHFCKIGEGKETKYLLTDNAYQLVVVSSHKPKAIQFKEEYIKRFNKMQEITGCFLDFEKIIEEGS